MNAPAQFRRREQLLALGHQVAAVKNMLPYQAGLLLDTMRSLLTDYDERLTALENREVPIL